MVNKCECCNKRFVEGQLLWYCNNCEKYLDDDCVVNHIEHDIIPLKYVNNNFEVVMMTPYGGGSTSCEWFCFHKDVFLKDKKIKCKHVIKEFYEQKPIIEVNSMELFCCDCFNKNYENLKEHDRFGDFYVLLNDNSSVRHLNYDAYKSRHLNYLIDFPKNSKKGEHVKISLIIKNLGKTNIKNVNISIIGFSRHQITENDTINYELEMNDDKKIIQEEEYISEIESKSNKKIIFDIYIPKDYEIKSWELIPCIIENNIKSEPLVVFNPLILYFTVSFANEFGVTFNEYIGSKCIKLN